jgi:hypothetical protein
MTTRFRRGVGLVTLAALATSLILVAPVSAKPAGNNGTVKIDGEPFDSHPDNEPHVGCTFQVDFYGFDAGDLYAHVTFEGQPPSGRATLLEHDVFIGEDDHAGGGSQAGLDASVTYELDVSSLTEHPVQGYHVRLTIEADGSRGADTKHKTFWVTGCEPPCEDPPSEDPPSDEPPGQQET